jgi:hypothetical protein
MFDTSEFGGLRKSKLLKSNLSKEPWTKFTKLRKENP